MMQGTIATYDANKGESALQQWSTPEFDVWEFKVKKRPGPIGQAAGVAILATPVRLERTISSPYRPPSLRAR